MPFVYFLMPGLNFVIILIAYFLNKFWVTFFVTYFTILFWISVSYFTYEKLFLRKFEKDFKKEKTYKVLKIWYKEGPFNMALLVRLLIIPLFYKNMFLLILKTSFRDYMLSAVLGDGLHVLGYALIGIHVKKIQMSR